MIYEIKGEKIKVTNEIKDLDNLIYGRFSQFPNIQTQDKILNFLRFNNNSIEINIRNKYKILKNKIEKTDIYPIINNVIAYLINDNYSTLVSKNNNGILIVGDFGSGKSTLANEFKKNGYEINSTDQTWIEVRERNIYQKRGSKFDIKDGNVKLLEDIYISKSVQIKKIIRIVGLCDNGDFYYNLYSNNYHIIKNLSFFCNWNYLIPIFTGDIELYDTNKYVKSFLNNIIDTKIQIMDVRGDKKKIIKEIGDI